MEKWSICLWRQPIDTGCVKIIPFDLNSHCTYSAHGRTVACLTITDILTADWSGRLFGRSLGDVFFHFRVGLIETRYSYNTVNQTRRHRQDRCSLALPSADFASFFTISQCITHVTVTCAGVVGGGKVYSSKLGLSLVY